MLKISGALYPIDITTIIAYSFFSCLPAIFLEGQGEYRMSPIHSQKDHNSRARSPVSLRRS